MAIQAALTGFCLSTHFTNDAPSSLTRLHDLGVATILNCSTDFSVLAQRLVRRLCVHFVSNKPPLMNKRGHLTFDYMMDMQRDGSM